MQLPEEKICGKCKQIKPVEDFAFKNKAKGTRNSHCNNCKNKYKREWEKTRKTHNRNYYLANKERRNEYSRKWKAKNRDRDKETKAKWNAANKEKRRDYEINRECFEKLLPKKFDKNDKKLVYQYFGGCALTGEKTTGWDHVISLSTGHGGTI
ncbi:hypothetical protein CHI02_23745, partial [Niallia circulans]|uniref:hypothetical protein n=1 Tax=Niallia circulans TaxID=1397 RepID=UPI000BC89EF0